jgi:hypothetical protein
MQQKQSSENEADNNRNNQEPGAAISRITGTAIAIWIFVAGGAILWVAVHDNVADTTKSFEVFIASIFSLALVIVVVIQAGIYFKQARAMDAQQEIMGTSLRVSQQSYVGVHSIADRELSDGRGKIILIKIENIGNVPADEIRVRIHFDWALFLTDLQSPTVGLGEDCVIDRNFGRTKLFKGKLKIEIPIPYKSRLSKDEFDLLMAGRIFLTVWGHIVYKDGFGDGNKTEFSFSRTDDGRWLINAPEDIARKIEGGQDADG